MILKFAFFNVRIIEDNLHISSKRLNIVIFFKLLFRKDSNVYYVTYKNETIHYLYVKITYTRERESWTIF